MELHDLAVIESDIIYSRALSDENQGAYWEAGYAEGLDKPVIYTCSKEKFKGIHFDTSHLLCIKWDPDDPSAAGEMLKATIRNTLPNEAIMQRG